MPLTAFQRGVAHILAKHRNTESHVAGGAVINRGAAGRLQAVTRAPQSAC
jgi:hypothetical protein